MHIGVYGCTMKNTAIFWPLGATSVAYSCLYKGKQERRPWIQPVWAQGIHSYTVVMLGLVYIPLYSHIL